MVRSYLRHGPTEAFGLICSSGSNSVWDGKLAYVPALEDVLVWDVKKGEMIAMWHETGHRAEVTCIVQSLQKDTFAVGYGDGSIRLWDAESKSVKLTFNGHKRAVTALAFDQSGLRLASGSQDTDIIVWDVVAEAGLYRLRGHRDQITAIRFLTNSGDPSSSTSVSTPTYILSTSKDTFMKLWSLSNQHCVQTVVAHSSEIWSLDVSDQRDLVFTGGDEGELKAWRIDREALQEGLKEGENGEISKMIHYVSSFPLSSRHRVSSVQFHPNQPYLAVQSHDKSVEIFRIRTEEEVRKKQARRKKREREKAKSQEKDTSEQMEPQDEVPELVSLFTPHVVIRASGKIRSFDFGIDDHRLKGAFQLFTALSTNSLEVFSVPPPTKNKEQPPEATKLFSLDLPGHRTDIRTICISSDDSLLASGSNGAVKIWNLKTMACVRTLDCSHAICSCFLPGDRQLAVGTKSGELLIYDLASSALSETIQAHSATLWSLHLSKDGLNLVTGSADKDVKFWKVNAGNFPQIIGEPPKSAIEHVRTLKMTDDVLSVRLSPNGKYVAVSLLDSTVKVFYQDSLKFFLSLYGHKLPVISMDISDDSKLIVTSSADKNVKIWGLDYGDCHKSIFAHDESVMQVAFEKESHYFWTVSKDRLLKYWDGDKFENIQRLEGHHGEIWALAVSNRGNFVATGSHDKSIRIWEKLDEPLFLEEEREREMEQLYEGGIADSLNQPDAAIGSGVEGADTQAQATAEATAVSKQTTDTLMAGEKLMEALDLSDAERDAFALYEETKAKLTPAEAAQLPPPARNAVLAAYDLEPEAYVLHVVEKIQSTALVDALLVLPFGKVLSLMVYLNYWAEKGWNIPLCSRIIFFLLKTHHHQIVAQRVMRTALIPLRTNLRTALLRQKEVLSYNLAGLRYIQLQDENQRNSTLLEDITDEEKIAELRSDLNGDKKRKRVSIHV